MKFHNNLHINVPSNFATSFTDFMGNSNFLFEVSLRRFLIKKGIFLKIICLTSNLPILCSIDNSVNRLQRKLRKRGNCSYLTSFPFFRLDFMSSFYFLFPLDQVIAAEPDNWSFYDIVFLRICDEGRLKSKINFRISMTIFSFKNHLLNV